MRTRALPQKSGFRPAGRKKHKKRKRFKEDLCAFAPLCAFEAKRSRVCLPGYYASMKTNKTIGIGIIGTGLCSHYQIPGFRDCMGSAWCHCQAAIASARKVSQRV